MSSSFRYPLKCWDIFFDHLQRTKINDQADFATLHQMTLQFGWNLNLLPILCQRYDALVLTDKEQNIRWVSEGFHQMTGYAASYAVGKTPRFLQGENTCSITKAVLRKHLINDMQYKGIVNNYRKDGTEYKCKIHIYPIPTPGVGITNYLAVEQEIN